MVHLEEGFRRIGVATYWVAILLGILVFFGTGNVLFACSACFGVIILFHIALYVVKGFIKQSDGPGDKD